MTATELANALAAPFPADEVQFKAQAVSGNRCLAVAYIDARTVMDRLDAVMGPGGWFDRYTLLPCGSVLCELTLTVDGLDVTKQDVGSPSEQPDNGDKLKAAFSDALKRAGVKWGIGRYLYSLPKQWVDYDPAKKRIISTLNLPPWALPPVVPGPKPRSNGTRPAKAPEPQTGTELATWLDELDAYAAKKGYCPAGHVRAECYRLSGEGRDIAEWPTTVVAGVVGIARDLVARLKAGDTPLAQQLRASIAEAQGRELRYEREGPHA